MMKEKENDSSILPIKKDDTPKEEQTSIRYMCSPIQDVVDKSPLCGVIDCSKELQDNVVRRCSLLKAKDVANLIDSVIGSTQLENPSRWVIDSNESSVTPLKLKHFSEPDLSALASLELSTSLLAKDYGIPKITSVATQISVITDRLESQTIPSIKELIAPSEMMEDLRTLALITHKSFTEERGISKWQLGVVDTASYLVDRQIDWASQLYNAVCDGGHLSLLSDLSHVTPKTNFIPLLPSSLEIEKEKERDVTPLPALKNSDVYRLLENGKGLVNKMVDLNRLCERSGLLPIFKYSGGIMIAAATLGSTVCSTKETFGDIIDSLYKMFYENIEHIKVHVSEREVKENDIFQCIFRVKDIRTDYRHDYEHGANASIRKKNINIGDSYKHYAGRRVLFSANDFFNAQIKLYEEFSVLVDYLVAVVEALAS